MKTFYPPQLIKKNVQLKVPWKGIQVDKHLLKCREENDKFEDSSQRVNEIDNGNVSAHISRQKLSRQKNELKFSLIR